MATRVIARAATHGLADWRIEEDDYGDLMIFHRHVADDAPAYIVGRGAEHQLAQCSGCMQYLELIGTRPAPVPD
jgi:hypothetical protein